MARAATTDRRVPQRVPHSRVVPRRQVRHLGALGTAVRAPRTATGTPATCTSRTQQQYKYHVRDLRPSSKVGYKDVIPTWKGDEFDARSPDVSSTRRPARNISVAWACTTTTSTCGTPNTSRAGTRSRPGRRRTSSGCWQKAARKHGLRFAVSEHLSNSYNWFAMSHGADKTGPLAGVPYDGADPAYADLYHPFPKDQPIPTQAMSREAPDAWKQHYFKRIKDLIDNYQPDLLYTDGGIPSTNTATGWSRTIYNTASRGGGCLHQQDAKDCETAPACWTSSAAWRTTF